MILCVVGVWGVCRLCIGGWVFCGGGSSTCPTATMHPTCMYPFTHMHHLHPHTTSTHTPQARVRIHFINEYGVEEAGVDGGGIFKEFIESLVLHGFSPNKAGLFKVCLC